MKNSKKSISANEINKYTYCPYQWYYERLYGRKHIMEKYKERNELYNMKNATLSNFGRGLKFHKRYLFYSRMKFILKIAILIAISIISGYLFKVFKGF